jgi:hypothetical protein
LFGIGEDTQGSHGTCARAWLPGATFDGFDRDAPGAKESRAEVNA